VRRLAVSIALACAGAGVLYAKPRRYEEATPDDPNRGNFWRNATEPHADEVAMILAKARQAISQGDTMALQDLDAKGIETRNRSFSDSYGMLRYARKLSPENVEVLTLLGRAADESGKTRQAIEALESAAQLLGPDKPNPDVTGRLGLIYLRLGQLDDAIRWLRQAQGPLSSTISGQVVVGLATALAARGEMSEGVDTLIASVQPQNPYGENALVSFALVVFYDRDEQRSAAFEIVDRMQSALQQQYGSQIQQALAGMRFAPPEDQHYYQALLYETTGDYTESRAEWVLYADTGGQYRARALEHVRDIDGQRRAKPGSHAITPTITPHRRHHP
jgi:tetratricopeptide (TPR) repeat protein